ncbi:MAG: MBOAT family O-acyltransferase [Cycloclasticus sp.]|jgi:Predicted membrane protein involved in D-alanine export
MLFNSYEFILVFLPVALLLFYLASYFRLRSAAVGSLVLMSLFFYGYWNPEYLPLMAFSIAFNYSCGFFLTKYSRASLGRIILSIGIGINLLLIGYFKYSNFFIDQLNYVTENEFNIAEILLPLAISFFTFQQIAYLVDVYRGSAKHGNFLDYCLFVTFFPQLIAGPIVHHNQVMSQFQDRATYRFNLDSFTIGLSIFAIGLIKKVLIADNIAVYATPVFGAAEVGGDIGALQAWLGVLAYTLQIYFDFSGYSDMAIGLARMFNIKLPINFDSPYKSRSIIEFWRRWHITLSNFLRDYLYFALGGNRKGKVSRYSNLMITMLLGGLWHGAGWNFVIWGAIHGFGLMINHGWRTTCKHIGFNSDIIILRPVFQLLTFLVVMFAWVFFRAETLDGALYVFQAMSGVSEIGLSALQDIPSTQWNWLFGGLLVAFFAPNSLQLMHLYADKGKSLNSNISSWKFSFMLWQPGVIWGVIMFGFAYHAFISLSKPSEFLYFAF